MKLQVKPDSVRPGDRLTPTRGRYQGVPCEVMDVRHGPHSTYDLMVRPLAPLTAAFKVDFSEMLNVERPDA